MAQDVQKPSAPEENGEGKSKEKVEVHGAQFQDIGKSPMRSSEKNNINMLMNLDLPVAVELGRVQMMVKDILELGPGAVVELNKFSGEPVDVFVNNKKFAEGEVVVVDQNFGVRITALIGPDEMLESIK